MSAAVLIVDSEPLPYQQGCEQHGQIGDNRTCNKSEDSDDECAEHVKSLEDG